MSCERQPGEESVRDALMPENADRTGEPSSPAGAAPPATATRESVLERARTLDPLQLSTLEVRRLIRLLRKLPGERDVRIAYSGNVTLDPLSEFAEASLACSGLVASSYVA